MNDMKAVVAKNIAALRQDAGMTQSELAQHLNYSDKAVSKWERAESLPDISVLVELAALFQVSLDYLVCADHGGSEESSPTENTASGNLRYRHRLITCMAVTLVWLVVTAVFVMISVISGHMGYQWITFVYGLLASSIVWLVFNSIWFNRRNNYGIISLMIWSLAASIHVSILPSGVNIWMIYLLCIPGEVAILLWSKLKKKG